MPALVELSPLAATVLLLVVTGAVLRVRRMLRAQRRLREARAHHDAALQQLLPYVPARVPVQRRNGHHTRAADSSSPPAARHLSR